MERMEVSSFPLFIDGSDVMPGTAMAIFFLAQVKTDTEDIPLRRVMGKQH